MLGCRSGSSFGANGLVHEAIPRRAAAIASIDMVFTLRIALRQGTQGRGNRGGESSRRRVWLPFRYRGARAIFTAMPARHGPSVMLGASTVSTLGTSQHPGIDNQRIEYF